MVTMKNSQNSYEIMGRGYVAGRKTGGQMK